MCQERYLALNAGQPFVKVTRSIVNHQLQSFVSACPCRPLCLEPRPTSHGHHKSLYASELLLTSWYAPISLAGGHAYARRVRGWWQVDESDPATWKETLAILVTYATADEFAALCDSLATRLKVSPCAAWLPRRCQRARARETGCCCSPALLTMLSDAGCWQGLEGCNLVLHLCRQCRQNSSDLAGRECEKPWRGLDEAPGAY